MKFIEIITIDWYDNILKAFCRDSNNIFYYCSILALDKISNEKIYVCIDVKYLERSKELYEIIKDDSFKENWNKLHKLIKIKRANEAFLIKTTDLLIDDVMFVKYKTDYAWPNDVIWGEYPDVLDEAAKIDNWWLYFNGLDNYR